MTRTTPTDVEDFYGAAILLLRGWGRRWSVARLSEKSDVSAGLIRSFERGKAVPSAAIRRKLASALDVIPSDLDRLAAAVQRGMGLFDFDELGSAKNDRLVAKVAADLAAEFHDAVVPLVKEYVATTYPEPPPDSPDEAVLALAPIVRKLGLQELRSLVKNLQSLHRWAFVKLIGEESAYAVSIDILRARELAELGLRIAERVSGVEDWASLVYGWAFLCNVRRESGDLAGAEEAFAQAEALRKDRPEGRPDLPEPWRYLEIEAALHISRHQVPEALRLLDQAARLAPQTGPIPAHLLCTRANALSTMGDPEGSIAALREGLTQVNEETEPHLLWLLQFNLAEALTSHRQAAEAVNRLPELRRLQAQLGHELTEIRLRWLEGRIDAALGQLDRAIETLSWVRAAFAEKRLKYEEAQAGMELAGLYLEQERTADAVKQLVLQMEAVSRPRGIPKQARKALQLVRQAVEAETLTVELARRAAAYLYKARHVPELRFIR